MAQLSNRDNKGRVACCRSLEDLLSPKLFKALADPRRLALLIRLAEAGEPRTVSVVADGSGVDLSVVSRHLAILRDAGIIQSEKRGKEVWCVVQTHALVKILRNLADALETCCPDGWRANAGERVSATKRGTTRTARTR
jgi:ArsR family transcriptional regulator